MMGRPAPHLAMAGLVPAFHDFLATAVRGAGSDHSRETVRKQSVDGRHKAGHDDQGSVEGGPERAGAFARERIA
jgi:hypothetical protein